MNCPTCGAPLHLNPGQDHCQCDYCESEYFPDKNEEGFRVFGETSSLNCPVCAVPLADSTVGGARSLYCNQCHGTLLSMEIFSGLIEELRAQLPSPPLIPEPPGPKEFERRLSCPQCHDAMNTHVYAGGGNVVMDSCSPCELNWLDRGELMRIVHSGDYGGRYEEESE